MDTQGPNPWSFQRLQMQLPKDPYTTDDTNYNNDTNNDSTATTPHTDYDTHAYPKNIFYDTPTREQESDIAHDYSVEGHVRTWSFQDTLTNSDHGDDEGEDKEEEPATMTSLVITSDQLVLSSSKDIIPADAPSEVGTRELLAPLFRFLIVNNALNGQGQKQTKNIHTNCTISQQELKRKTRACKG